MILLKKLILAPSFLIIFAILISQLNPLLKSYEFIFSLSLDTFIQLIVLSGLILLSSFSLVLFTALAFDWKIVLPVGLSGSLIPMIFVSQTLGLILSVGFLAVFLIIYLGVENTLKNYLTFEPNSLFGPPIRHLASLLILVVSLTYFLSISQVIQKQGFEIPDSLIESSLKLISQPQPEKTQNSPQPKLQIPPEQPPGDLLSDTVKQAIKDQLQNVLKPYLGIIPAILAVLLFLMLQSLMSILNLMIHPVIWIMFYILEKSGFIKFTEEMREVRKMVV